MENCPFKNIYHHDGNTEFLLKPKRFNCEIRIECKWQQSNGSVDEKFPYLYLNCIEAMPEKGIVIIVDGDGAKAGAITWLQETVKSKNIHLILIMIRPFMFFHWPSLSNGLILDLDDSYNIVFKAGKQDMTRLQSKTKLYAQPYRLLKHQKYMECFIIGKIQLNLSIYN